MRRLSRAVIVATLVVVGLAVPALLALARYPEWWAWIAPEQTPMTWFQSVTLVVIGVLSLLSWFVARITHRRPRLGFALLGVGFFALAFDERFAVHERVRDGVLAPRGITVPGLTWVAPGDFLIMTVALAGLLVLPVVLRALGRDRWVLGLFAAGVVLSLVAVGSDSIDPRTWTVDAERVQQTLEECVELWAGLSFLGAVTLRLLGQLTELAGQPVPVSTAPAVTTSDAPVPQAERDLSPR